MSLINEMLRDLEKRHKDEGGQVSCCEAPVVVQKKVPTKLFWIGGGILLVLGVLWFGFGAIPTPQTTELATSSPVAQPKVVTSESTESTNHFAVIPDASAETITAAGVSPTISAPTQSPVTAVTEIKPTELLSLQVVENQKGAQLSLVFTQLPEYRLVENGAGAVRLVISFSQTQIGADFTIPELTGKLFKGISLIPGEHALRLMADLGERARVQSLQFVDNPDHDHTLLIKVMADPPVVEEPLPATVTPEPVAVTTEKVIESEEPAPAKVTKNRKPVRLDKQAYRAGMRQLGEGDLAAAEASFHQAISVNPKFLDARLQLVDLLQRQMKITAAEAVLRQGLELTPGNLDLRKVYAQLLLHAQRQNEAIELLKTKPLPKIRQDLEYYALLAALYQDSGEYETASLIYAQLLKVKPQAPLWWLGMAISLEQAGNRDQARSAYQKALNLPGLRPDLQNYIQSRLQTL